MKKLLIIITVLIFLAPTFSFAQDNALTYIEAQDQDDNVLSLREIEKLIKDTDYEEALKQLHTYIEKYPDRFDNAQRLIKTIMLRRNRYSTLTEKAIKSSTENPEDHETVAKIILEMKTLEKKPPKEIKDLVDLLEDMHLFKYYAYLFDVIQKESAQLTHQNDRFGAIEKVKEGFWVYKEEFIEEWGNNTQIINEEQSITDELNGYLAQIQNQDFIKRYNNNILVFVKNVNENKYDAAMESYKNAEQVMNEYAAIRNKILNCSEKYKALYEKQKKINPKITDASYLPFMQRYVSGINSVQDSGINGALNYEWNKNYKDLKIALSKIQQKNVNEYTAALPDSIVKQPTDLNILKNLQPNVQNINRYGELAKNVNSLTLNNEKKDSLYLENITEVQTITGKVNDLYSIVTQLNEKIQEQNQIRSELKNNKNQPDYDSSAYVRSLFNSLSDMNKITGEQSSYKYALKVNNSKNNTGVDLVDCTNLVKVYDKYVEEIFNLTLDSVTKAWNEISQSFIDDASSYEKIIKEYNQSAQNYLLGFAEKIDARTYKKLQNNPQELLNYAKTHPVSKDPNNVYVYPDLCLQMFEYSKSVSDKYEGLMQSAQEEFKFNLKEHPQWQEKKQITDIVEKSETYMSKKSAELKQTNESTKEIENKSKKQIELAQNAKQSAEDYYSKAVQYFNKEDYEQSQKALAQSNEQYAISLNYQDNPELRDSVDKKSFELSEKIINAYNEIVIKQTRELYTKAVNAQNQDDYDNAQVYINSAITKWAQTHNDENEELENLRAVINTAVSMKTGRILITSDPLYAEMSQLLNIAYQYYDEGKEYYNKEQKEQGDNSLNLALENLTKIKKIYPINQEASLLMLKIDQLRDREKFEKEFAQRIKDAVAKCKNKDTQTEGYNNLVNYYNINPSYKGLKSTIENMEIQLGMKQKPIDTSAQTRSTKITNEAQSLFASAGSDEAKLNRALQRVNEALRINPNNKTAQNLKDRISTKIGGSTSIVLTASDNNLLTRAKNEYQAGRIDEANIIMIQILKNNPQNIRVKAVSDLKKKIDARL